MNTKQVEEQTGISRQNIRYYERQGLLEPAREMGNAYRDYSEEDVKRLKLIKMLRMLDMPLKEVEHVLKKEIPLKAAIEKQQEALFRQQKQLQAAIQVCASIYKEKVETVDVDGYLQKMETMSLNGSLFTKIVDDYKQVASEERERQFSFYTSQAVHTESAFEKVLRHYASECQMKFKLQKGGMYPLFTLDGVLYTAARVLKREEETNSLTRIVCVRESSEAIQKEIPKGRRSALQGIYSVLANIRRHKWKSSLNVLVSLLIVVVMALYIGNMNSANKQLKYLHKSIPVSAQVWNMVGDKKSGLFISEQIEGGISQSAYVKNVKEGTAPVTGGDRRIS